MNNKLRGNHDLPSQLILPVYFIGKVYLQMNNLDSSKYYFNEANNLAKRANDKHSLVMTSVALAEIYRLNNENSKAINILKKNFTENSNGDDTLNFNNNIGSIYYGLGNYKKALKYFINCLRYTDKYFDYYLLQERHLLIVLYSHISEAYFKTGDHISSYQYSILTQKLSYIGLNGNKGILSESDYYSFFNLYCDKIDRFNQLSILLYNNIIGEEFGAITRMLVVAVFGFIVVRGMISARRNADPFSRMAGAGLVMLFGLQSFINMAVNLNMIPPKGMTLPFLSYGGSSLLSVAITTGLLLAVTRKRPKAALTERMTAPHAANSPSGMRLDPADFAQGRPSHP